MIAVAAILRSIGVVGIVAAGLLCVGAEFASAQITFTDLQKITQAFHDEYDLELSQANAAFFVNRPPTEDQPTFWWDQQGDRAAYGSYVDRTSGFREHYIFFFHGMGEYQGMTIDSAIMTLCHELGHGLGGAPYKDAYPGEPDISIEAVADDYAARVCFPRMSRRVPTTQDYRTRFFAALEFDRIYYRTNPEILEETSFDKKDESVVLNVITRNDYYPPSQCRIDTMIAGLEGRERPACWWPTPLP